MVMNIAHGVRKNKKKEKKNKPFWINIINITARYYLSLDHV